ncbi:superoxide dismutase family protein [Actinomadura sp. NEAU-AAG7]|uniref:superoxide dismutase family protein n=1 Tax=Actinomadura sp. NEAU-AAG7 TaxID=2839640 RepID=UPI001BE4C8EF|nr:superoxide dismutase family protein [Actinomadura sp. NEAU-AAG7]MBT2208514.1 superoxide dismutase family protein [Actinomadura sp. NEAU-AAG7]
MPLTVRAALTLATAGVALASLPVPAMARDASARGEPPREDPHIISVGPTYVYDPAYSGVRTEILVAEQGRRTIVNLKATGFPAKTAGRTFGAHVHRKACGKNPADAGEHYRDPRISSKAPLRDKEIWLDLKVRRDGTAKARTVHRGLVAHRAAGSIVIHAEPTDPRSGGAGTRLLCTNVPF